MSEDSYYTVQEPEDESEVDVAIEREHQETMDLKRCLKTHQIYLDRRIEKTHDLKILITRVSEQRQAPLSPKSKKIASANRHTRELSEIDAMILLEDFLGYMPEDSLRSDGERGVLRSHNQQWNTNVVPIPATEHDESLAAAVAAAGSPPKPKPDITYGYSDHLFLPSEMTHAAGLSPATRLTDQEPLWPFFIVEWKSDLGQMENCRLQAMRDGAAAVNGIWHLFNVSGTIQPQEHETAVFCACVGPTDIELYVSWRRDHPTEGLSWEMDRICDAKLDRKHEVFHVRSVLLNILEWARSTRVDRIKAELRPSKHMLNSVEDEQNSGKQKPAKRGKLNEGREIRGPINRKKTYEEGVIGQRLAHSDKV